MTGAPPSDEIPADVSALLGRLETVMHLELVLALRTADGPCTPRDLMRRIGGSVDQVARALAQLELQGLATRSGAPPDDAFSYRANGEDGAVDRLVSLFPTRRVRIISHLLRSGDDHTG